VSEPAPDETPGPDETAGPDEGAGSGDRHQRHQRERHYHDHHYEAAAGRAGADRFYRVTGPSTERFTGLVTEAAAGADALEYGCAGGELALSVAPVARSLIGFDISPVAIGQAQAALATAQAEDPTLVGRVRFEVVEAEELPFASGSFDLAFGAGVLHHMELGPTMAEMRRVLRPGGQALFLEPLGHNPAINWYRRRTPGVRTPDEHPFTRADIEAMAEGFERARVEFFHLAVLGAVAAEGRPSFEPVRRALARLDRVLLDPRSPLRWWGWICVVQLSGRR
jgi:SAM-dependent methyltransferase